MARIAFLVDDRDQEYMEGVTEILEKNGQEVIIYSYVAKDDMFIKKTYIDKIDLLITFNCKGYEMHSLTNGISLNFLNSKVLNILYEEEFEKRSFLQDNPISISNFFYFKTESLMKKYMVEYPQIPFAKVMNTKGEQKTNGTMLYDSICEVLKMTYLI